MQLPKYIKPEGYPKEFFTDIQSSDVISTTTNQKTNVRTGLVNGHTYTDSSGNVRHKYEVIKTLSKSAINAELDRIAAIPPITPKP